MEVTLQPGGLVAPEHVHSREDETAFVVDGRLGVLLGERVQHAGPGSTVFAPRHFAHTFWNAGQVTARIILVITPGTLDGYFRGISELGIPPSVEAIAEHAIEFGMELRPESLPGLASRHGVTLM
jgi:hypothetical protein